MESAEKEGKKERKTLSRSLVGPSVGINNGGGEGVRLGGLNPQPLFGGSSVLTIKAEPHPPAPLPVPAVSLSCDESCSLTARLNGGCGKQRATARLIPQLNYAPHLLPPLAPRVKQTGPFSPHSLSPPAPLPPGGACTFPNTEPLRNVCTPAVRTCLGALDGFAEALIHCAKTTVRDVFV